MSEDKVTTDQAEDKIELIVSEQDQTISTNPLLPSDAPLKLADGLVGKILDEKYEVIAPLGSGGMSVVYKARHALLNKSVALKVLSLQRVLDDAAVLRFRQEAKAACSLGHPNIVVTRDFGQDAEGRPYLVMDYIEGQNLEELVKQQKGGVLDPERTIRIISQVCAGMAHAHKAGVIHRDIKPANIIVSQSADGKEAASVVDFGIAKIVSGEEGQNLTQSGEVFGSPLYMSPEQCLGKKVDSRSDIYSLGCVMYEALTGMPPFQGNGSLATLMLHVGNAPDSLLTIRSGKLIERVDSIVLKCLEKNPKDRYQSMDALADDLKLALEPPAGWSPPHRPNSKSAPQMEQRESTKFLSSTLEERNSELSRNKVISLPGASVIAAGFLIAAIMVGISISHTQDKESSPSEIKESAPIQESAPSQEQKNSLSIGGEDPLLDPGRALYFEGKYKEAIEAYTNAEQSNPEMLWLHQDRANAYYHLGMKAEALSDIKKQLQQYPYESGPLLFASETLNNLKQPKLAKYYRQIADYNAVLKADKNNAQALKRRAMAFDALDEPSLAASDWERLPESEQPIAAPTTSTTPPQK